MRIGPTDLADLETQYFRFPAFSIFSQVRAGWSPLRQRIQRMTSALVAARRSTKKTLLTVSCDEAFRQTFLGLGSAIVSQMHAVVLALRQRIIVVLPPKA